MSDFRERLERLSPKRLMLLALDLQTKLEDSERQRTEPIAIVGLGCRIPGSEAGPGGFWQLLKQGVDAICDVPDDRWDRVSYHDSNPDVPGRMSTTQGSFLAEKDHFDAQFFSISRREAVSMDPQQRVLLEVCWEALEHAGYAPRTLSGSSAGVFVGISTNDYHALLLNRGEQSIDAYLATGTAHSIAAGRISYALGLQGPSIAVDTACSASLVGVHMACQSLRNRECGLALAGGVNMILSPEVTIALSKAHMMAADGRCKTFDAAADGFVRGEGCGMVVLKRLSDAEADGDRILAVIRGSAVNQDGRSSGLTAPNGVAQEALLKQALANARVSAEEIGYVEAHGTGTSLGDPIEAHALARVLGKGRNAENPLVVGSVKTNLGHLEAAAGVAGLIKVVLSLEEEWIPQHLHFEKMNPHIDWQGVPVEIPVEGKAWRRGGKRRLAGVSSFGFSGTNAHVIVEEAPMAAERKREYERPQHILALSARSASALEKLVERYAEELSHTTAEVGDICYTANAGRAHFDERAVYLGASKEQLREALRGKPLVRGSKQGAGTEMVFLFPGQGSQYAGMGKELYETQPVFRRKVEECAELLKSELAEPLLEVLWGAKTELLEQTAYTQPALFAIEYGLAELWKSWGIEPSAVLGHSVGEYVAACVAGVYSLADGLRLIAARGRLMQQVAGQGAMASVGATEERVREALKGFEERVSVAGVNARESVVISGYEREVGMVEERLRREGIRVQRLAVSHGFHSPQMREMEEAFEGIARQIRFAAPRVRLISSVTGKVIGREELSEGGYWRRQVREPVRFQAAIETLAELGYRVFVEAGPGTVLSGLGRQTLTSEDILWGISLKKKRAEWETLLEALGRLYVRGAEINWAGFDQPYQRRRVALPTYPFERQRYWIDEKQKTRAASRESITSPDELSSLEVPADWYYKPDWQAKPVSSAHHAPDRLIPLSVLAGSLEPVAAKLRLDHGLDRYDTFSQHSRMLSARYILRALEAAGFDFLSGAAATTADLQNPCKIGARHQMLFRRMLAILAEEGYLEQNTQADTWSTLRLPPTGDLESVCGSLRLEYPEFSAELEMLTRCGASLHDVLQERLDPLNVLFPGGSFETATRIYTDSPGPRVFNRIALETVSAELRFRTDGPIRVLEIGAGTGGTTTYLADVFPPERTEYWFTDVSAIFSAHAAQKFSRYSFFRYQQLDIEQEPTEQGFQAGQFDIVVATNVLHATADLHATTRHIRKLMAPDGLLIIIEATLPEPWVDLTFGLTEGWWRFRDFALRPAYPLLSRDNWLKLLSETGFSETEAVQPTEQSQQAVILARNPSVQFAAAGRWLILSNDAAMAKAFASECEKKGVVPCLARPGQSVARYLETESYNHVVDLSALECPASLQLTTEFLATGQAITTSTILETIQALLVTKTQAKLWLVTQGAQPVLEEGDSLSISQAPVWGLGKTVALEHPSIWGGLVDLDPVAELAQNSTALIDAILRNDGEDQSAFRQDTRYVARLERCVPQSGSPVSFSSTKIYLITGGLGGLGLKVARRMVEHGARHLVLTSRTGLPDRAVWDDLSANDPSSIKIAGIREIEQLGAEVRVAVSDVCNESHMAKLFASLPAENLGGIIHAATFTHAGLVEDLRRHDVLAVLGPKTIGTWILHRLTESLQLDFFVLFSSWASILGARELAHYAAANQFLDVFAHYRRSTGLPALTINWAAWDEVRAASEQVLRDYERGGLHLMKSELALSALERAITGADPQLAVASVDWTLLKPLYETQRRRPLLNSVGDSTPQQPENQKAEENIFSQLLRATREERTELLMASVREMTANVLRISSDTLNSNEGLFDLGMDSLMSLELTKVLERSFELSLPSTLVFNHPSVRAIADYIDAKLPLPPATTEDVTPEHDSEDELAEMLAAALRELN